MSNAQPQPRPRIGFDTETHLIVRGRLAPRMVCLSLAGWGDWHDCYRLTGGALDGQNGADEQVSFNSAGWDALLTGAKAVEAYRALLAGAVAGELDLVAHNAVFDLAVLAEAAAVHPGSAGPLLAETIEALQVGAVRDTLIREKLIAIAHDRLKKAPRGYFSLGSEYGLARRYLGHDRSAEKGKHAPCEACLGSGFVPLDERVEAIDVPCLVCDGYGSVGPWRLRYCQLDGVPLDQWPADAVSYAIDDAVDALRVSEAQDNAPATDLGPVVVEHRADPRRAIVIDEIPQLRAAFGFHLMAARGVCVDPHRTAELDAVVSKIVAEAKVVGLRAGFIRGDDGLATADPQQKKGRPGSECRDAKHALVSQAYGGDPPRNDPTDNEKAKAALEGREPVGSIKADRDVLLSTGHDDLIAYAEVGAELTIAKTYLPILREGVALGPVGAPLGAAGVVGAPCGPITSSPNVLVASGRCSWGKPNWTNPPRDGGFRECVVPRPGHVFVAADWGQAELRGLAQICLWEGFGDSMAQAFIDGRDPHAEFGADLLGISTAEMGRLLAAGDKLAKSRRQVAKVANFGFPGGMGAERFVAHARKQDVELHSDREKAIAEAWTLHAAFRRKWPEVLPYFSWVGSRTGTREDPKRFTARQYISERLRGGVGYCDGCNTYFQGLIADVAKAAVWDIARATYGGEDAAGVAGSAAALAGCRQVLFLHDENIIEVPCGDGSARYPLDLARLTAAADALVAIMLDAMRRYMPDIPPAADAAAMLRWVKGADEVRDGQGRLIPVDLPDGAVVVGGGDMAAKGAA